MNRRILLLCFLSVFGLTITAQVTIGSGTPPAKAALLELKNQEAQSPASVTDDANVTSKTGGLLLPRVKLIDKNTLQPFIATNDELWNEKETNKIREIHAGLMVYNLSITSELEQGIYVWDGAKWMITKTTIAPTDNNWSLKGNTGTITGTNFLGTTDAQGLAFKTNNTERMRITSTGNVGIGTTTPSASLHVEGDMKLKNTPAYTSANVMVVDNNGNVGVAAPEAPISKGLYAQSPTYQNIAGTALVTLNAGDPIVVTWAASDVQTFGGLLTRNADHSFTFNDKALCEVSGYINYQPNATPPPTYSSNYSEYVAAVNVIIQYATASAPNTWLTLTGARHLYPGATAGGPIQSVLVPAAIRTFQKNDKIRMVVKRPSATFGLAHGTYGVNYSAINVPTGSTYCKSLKVTTM